MDEVKLAFETLIVGVFGLVCILVLLDLVRPKAGLWEKGIELFKGSVGQSALTGLLILPVAYVIGAAEFPLADELFEMDSQIRFDLPVIESDDAIKVQTYVSRRDWLLASEFPPGLRQRRDEFLRSRPPTTRKEERTAERAIRPLYDYQKFVVLKDEDGYRLMKPLYEQVVVLRGTAFNAVILATICVLGWVFRRQERARYRDLLVAAAGIAVISVFGLIEAEREYDKYILGTYYAMHAVGTGKWRDAEENTPGAPQASAGRVSTASR